jgi:exonuclease III
MVECFSIISWNVRGLNSPARWEAIRDMVQAHMPKMVCLQETKMETMNQQVAV